MTRIAPPPNQSIEVRRFDKNWYFVKKKVGHKKKPKMCVLKIHTKKCELIFGCSMNLFFSIFDENAKPGVPGVRQSVCDVMGFAI